ncbi:MAG TPA: ATP synthase subunit I [Anaerolineae bacterium]|nr:ATP synthase subunit I [Anaerolineae bacterium]
MKIQQRILKFVIKTNWILLSVASIVGIIVSSLHFAMGIISGGLIVTINFHLLYRTLKKALTPPHLASFRVVLSKYYIRFILSALIIFVLISKNYVDPIGLFIGLSVVVVSITLATMYEFKKIIFKEAI